MLILMVGAMPAFNPLKGGRDFAGNIATIASSLEQSRTYAMANNTYVFWGIQSADASIPENDTPQRAGTGRVIIGVVASLDGTRMYDPNGANILTNWTAKTATGTGLTQLGKTAVCEGMTLSSAALTATGNLARPANSILPLMRSTETSIPFGLPLGGAPPRYSFKTCIQFDPQVTASVTSSQGGSSHAFELGFVRTYGSLEDAIKSNVAVLQIDASTGLLKIYRP